MLLTKYIKISHGVLCSPTSILWSCAKAGLCQWKIKHIQQLSKAAATDWHIQTNEYPSIFVFFIWLLQKKKEKENKPVANNTLRYLITLNSFREDIWLHTEKFAKGQSLQKLHFKTVIKETIKFPYCTHLWDIKKVNFWNARYSYCI